MNSKQISKKIQVVDLYFLKESKDLWLEADDNFSKYERFDLSYLEDIDLAKRKAERYKQIGCFSLAEQIQETISLIEENNILYHGYHRIKITVVSIILAKLLNLDYKENRILFSGKTSFDYEPRVYPLSELQESTSETIKHFIVDKELIFDSFCVVVPSLNSIFFESKKYCFMDGKSKIYSYSTKTEAQKALDLYLIKSNLIRAVLLGEKHGKCYFLNFFI